MESLLRDVRYALRRMRANRGFTVVAVLSIALGVGANTSNFSIVSAILIPESHYADPESLVDIYPAKAGRFGFGTVSYPELKDIVEGTGSVFEGVAAGTLSSPLGLERIHSATTVRLEQISASVPHGKLPRGSLPAPTGSSTRDTSVGASALADSETTTCPYSESSLNRGMRAGVTRASQ